LQRSENVVADCGGRWGCAEGEEGEIWIHVFVEDENPTADTPDQPKTKNGVSCGSVKKRAGESLRYRKCLAGNTGIRLKLNGFHRTSGSIVVVDAAVLSMPMGVFLGRQTDWMRKQPSRGKGGNGVSVSVSRSRGDTSQVRV